MVNKVKYDPAAVIEIVEELKHYRRQAIRFDVNRSALIIVDMQRYFVHPDGDGYMPQGAAIIENTLKLSTFFSENNRPIIFTRHGHSPDGSDAGLLAEWWSDSIVRGSIDWGVVDALSAVSSYAIIDKTQYDAFVGTNLQSMLEDTGSSDVVVSGVMTNLCVESTARSAFIRGFRPFIPADATAAPTIEMHRGTLLNLAYGFANVLMADEIVNWS